jgi:sugar phosphate isomerase/epimerase
VPYPLGTVDAAFRPDPPQRASERARDLGFDHIDTAIDVDPATLALPIGCPISPRPVPQFSMSLCRRTWEHTVAAFRDAPGALLEPAARSVVNSNAKARAICEEVPGLRLLIDTGHVADWGGDPVELLDLAGHIQLRQGKPGNAQLHVHDPDGVVDFRAVLRRLDALGYRGRLSVEYFDIPAMGWGLDDPVGWTVDLADHVRALMRAPAGQS